MVELVECSICWETIQSAEEEAGLVCCSVPSVEDDENEYGGFLAAFSWLWEEENICPKLHRSCLSKYLIIQAESGHFPPTCPFCLRKLSLVEVYNCLTAAEKTDWLRQHDRWRELRAGRADADLEEITALQDLGCRRCPSCGTWIQKQSGGWVTGCDKMTCRCGARFCFQCGSVEASCSCSLGHDFLEKELVLANYSLLNLPWPLSLLFEDEPDDESNEPSASHVGLQRPEPQHEELNAEVAEAAANSCEEQDLGPASSSTAAPQGQQWKEGTPVPLLSTFALVRHCVFESEGILTHCNSDKPGWTIWTLEILKRICANAHLCPHKLGHDYPSKLISCRTTIHLFLCLHFFFLVLSEFQIQFACDLTGGQMMRNVYRII